jgi:hypothetical protein
MQTPQLRTSWWLDFSALPKRLLWARLGVLSDGTAQLLDCDGVHHKFPSEAAARLWLLEDEYSMLEVLIENGDVPSNIEPPSATLEADLLPLMSNVGCQS